MKEFNKQLHDDIIKLKKLRLKKDKTEFKKFMTILIRRHKLSKSSIQEELRKPVPGTYRNINWALRYRPITEEEIKMVYELLYQNYTLEQVKRVMEERLGGNYGESRMNRIRAEMEKKLPELESNNTTIFGEGFKKLFNEYCCLDLMDPRKILELELLGTKYKVSCAVIKDAINMIIYSAEGDGKNTQELHRIRMENMLSKKLENMTASSQVSMTELRSAEIVRRSQEKGQSPDILTPDGKVLVACCRELRPDYSYSEIFALAKKHISLIKGTTEDILPDYKPAFKEAYEAIRNNPGSGFASKEVLKKAKEDGYWDMTEEEKDNWKPN